MAFIINRKKRFPLHLCIMALSIITLSSCASNNNDGSYESRVSFYDPFEDSNRRVMAFNKFVDKTVIHPVVKGYRIVAPQPARTGIRNFLRNLRSPITFANQVLQGDAPGARDALLRAVINTTIGIGGIFDVAGHEGIKYEQEDFGQTLAVWGVDHGPYMVVPFIGPSSMRDYTGYFVDSFTDPLQWYLFNIDETGIYTAKYGADYLELRNSLMDTLLDLELSSIDYYASVRSMYYQHRLALVNDQKGTAQSSIPSIPYYEDEDE